MAVPVLSDNYAYLLIDKERGIGAAIDPVEPEKVLQEAEARKIEIQMILTTHHHWDHAGGNNHLIKLLKEQDATREVPVYGGRGDGVEGVTHEVGQEDTITLGQLEIQVFQTPCHTVGHVLYLCEDALFTGDTLFIAGCGRFFSGTASQMHHALNHVVASLPETTRIYCGHEYTKTNLRFAQTVEPENVNVQRKLEWAHEREQHGEFTIPSTVAEELETNPFMRVTQPSVQKYTGQTDPVQVMAALRSLKDNFKIGRGGL